MSRQFFSGNSLEQAVMAAARHYGLEPDRVAYRRRDKKHGFVNVRRKVIIEVDPAAPELPPGESIPLAVELPGPSGSRNSELGELPDATGTTDASQSSRAGDHRPREDGQNGDERQNDQPQGHREPRPATIEDAFEQAFDEVVRFLGLDLRACFQIRDDVMEVEVEGPDQELMLEHDGRLLRAVESLLPRLVRGLMGRGMACRVDCAGFYEEREEELRELALEVAREVREEGVEQILEPMEPGDRRIVHLALADDPDVRTESEGEGLLKSVCILPA